MSKRPLPPLHRQVGRVYRRLLIQTLANTLFMSLGVALLLATGWFLLQPLMLAEPAAWLRWMVAGSLVGLAALVGLYLGFRKAPSRLVAALSLDREFGLKERVTTSLMLPAVQASTPVGQALLADTTERVKDLDVRSRFPFRLAWTSALVPIGALALAIVAVFYQPSLNRPRVEDATVDLTQPLPNAADVEKKMKDLVKKPSEKPNPERLKPEDLQKLEAELEKIANRPRENKEQVRERVKEMTALEEAMKSREKEMAEKGRTLKEQLQRLDRMSASKDGDGPAKDMEKALSEGKLDKAREEIEKISKRLQNQELTAKEQEQLRKQLENVQKKLERVAQQRDKEEQLKKANLDPQTLKRELDQLKKDKEKLADLQNLADQLGQVQRALKEGDAKNAGESLSQAANQMKNMEGDEQDLQDLRDQLARLTDAKDSC